MARNVYEYGRGGKCVCMFVYTYAGIKGGQTYEQRQALAQEAGSQRLPA